MATVTERGVRKERSRIRFMRGGRWHREAYQEEKEVKAERLHWQVSPQEDATPHQPVPSTHPERPAAAATALTEQPSPATTKS